MFAGMIIIAANSGGAWSPIGDVTTIMLWVNGNVSTGPLMQSLILPSLVSMFVPLLFATRILHGVIRSSGAAAEEEDGPLAKVITRGERKSIFILGICCLLAVPVFKSLTHLPPFMGILISLSVIWVYTEILYQRKKSIGNSFQMRVVAVLRRIDLSTILFFLGILLAVSALQSVGILGSLAAFLDKEVHNVFVIDIVIGLLSSVVDNVPLVASAMGMYPIADPAAVAAAADPSFVQNFVADGTFWHFLAYCAGVGGSVLIIGSAAGVVVMGIEKINFMWYLKNISLMALTGYLAGAGVYILQVLILGW